MESKIERDGNAYTASILVNGTWILAGQGFGFASMADAQSAIDVAISEQERIATFKFHSIREALDGAEIGDTIHYHNSWEWIEGVVEWVDHTGIVIKTNRGSTYYNAVGQPVQFGPSAETILADMAAWANIAQAAHES